MKILFYMLFKHMVFRRAKIIRVKKYNRLLRLRTAIDELQKWQDIPISWQYEGICKTLKIKPNEAGKSFVFELCFPTTDIESLARRLPLI